MDYGQHVGAGFGPSWRGILFRREYKQLANVVAESKKLFPRIFPGARFNESLSSYKWTFPAGEELYFRVVKRESDYWDYHGHEYPWVGWEELTTWPDLRLYEMLKSVCRSSTRGVPRKYRATTNPYGVGHNAVKAYFVDPAPERTPIANEDGSKRVRIHGSVYENLALLAGDPDYPARLEADPDPNRRKAWAYGSWDIVAGGIINDLWSPEYHVLEPFTIPSSWYIDRAFDWGSAKPFSVGWYAEADGSPVTLANGEKYTFPRGTIIRFAEWYGWNGAENEGLRLTAREIARGIIERERDMPYLPAVSAATKPSTAKEVPWAGKRGRIDSRANTAGSVIRPGPADSAIYNVDNGQSIADDMAAVGVTWTRSIKGPGSRVTGWAKLREMLDAARDRPLERPGFFVTSNCRHWIRTVPVLPRDDRNPDDVDTEAEDHAADETRYRITAQKSGASRAKTEGV